MQHFVSGVMVDCVDSPWGVYVLDASGSEGEEATTSFGATYECAHDAAVSVDVLADELAALWGPVTVGRQLTSQITVWPLADDADVSVFLVAAQDVPASARWVPWERLLEERWAPWQQAAVVALRNEMVLRETKPKWSSQRVVREYVLRPLAAGDLPGLQRLWAEESVTRNLGHRALTPQQAQLYVRGRLADAEGGSYFPLVLAGPDGVVGEGRITLSPRWSCDGATGKWNGSVGFSILPELQGQGLGTAVMRELVEICFAEMSLELVRATVFDRSLASARVMEKVGFERCGLNVNCFEDVDGTVLADYQYVLTRAGWVAAGV